MASRASSHTAPDVWHPLVSGAYFASALVLVMFSFQPVLTVISFISGFAYSVLLHGARNTLRTLRWLVPVLVLIAAVNPLFSAQGSTALFYAGPIAVHAESLAYGFFMGLLLISSVLWFSCAAEAFASDKVLALMGRYVPTVALVLSMTMRQVPDLVKRGRYLFAIHKSNVSEQQFGMRARLLYRAHMLSALLERCMEDSIETADAMRARGWGGDVRPSVYRRRPFTPKDGVAFGVIVLFIGACAVISWAAVSQFSFYPTLSALRPWWGYAAYTLFLLLPLIQLAVHDLRWGMEHE